MASTDTRSGFRLPWSSDRSHDQQPDAPAEDATLGDGSETTSPEDENVVWPESDLNARLGLTSQPRPADPVTDEPEAPVDGVSASTDDTDTPDPAREEATMLDQEAVTAPPKPAPKKPSKLMADLSAAIRATAETAREQALAQVDADVTQVVDAIRSGSSEGAEALRVITDTEIAAINEWSREEIERIKA
jgi:hypothetical protein